MSSAETVSKLAGDSAPAGSRPPRRTVRGTLARVTTEALAPWVVVVALPLAVAWRATHSAGSAVAWGLLVALTSSLIPMGVIVWGARAGRWDGHHVRDRTGRLVPFISLIASNTAGLALLVALDAPWRLTALAIGMLAILLVTGAVTAKWKISMHAAVAAAAVVALAVTYHPLMWLLTPLVAAIGWSRVQLGDHTTAQVVVGAFVGAATGGGVYVALI